MVQGRKPNLKRRSQIARLRSQGLTLQAIAKRLGVSRQCVHQTHSPPSHRRIVPCSGCRQHGGRPRPGGAVLCLTCLRQPLKAALAQRLKELRRARGIGRVGLARQAGVATTTVWLLETGHHWPQRTTAKRLAKALGVTVAVLTGQEPLPLNPERNGKQSKGR